MQEESTTGPHSYLAGYVVLALGAVLGIILLVFAGIKGFWGDGPMEKCDVRLARLATRIQQDFVAKDGVLPTDLSGLRAGELTRCPYCRDEAMATGDYRYTVTGRDTFVLECRYEAHRAFGVASPKVQYRSSLTEGVQALPGD